MDEMLEEPLLNPQGRGKTGLVLARMVPTSHEVFSGTTIGALTPPAFGVAIEHWTLRRKRSSDYK